MRITFLNAYFQVKKGAAEKEEAWEGAGQDVGLQIWRIVKFKVRCCTHELYILEGCVNNPMISMG